MQKLALILLTSFLMFWRLGDTHLTNWDEAWYADVARTVAQTGNIFTPIWNDQPFLEKPPLFYWLTAISYKIFGDNEFSARLVSALAGIGTILLVFKFGGLSSATMLLSTPAFLWRARTGNLDSLLTFFILLSAVYPNLRGIASGFAFLTKGFIGFLYPLISGFKGLALGALIVLTWFVISYLVNGQLFIQQFFTQQGEKIGAGHFSLDYLIHLKTGLKLWVIILIPAIYALRKSMHARFIIVYLVLLSLLQEKSTWFLHPVYPFIALTCGKFLSRFKKSIIFVIAIALFQLIYFRNEYIVPDIAADEAKVAIASRQLTSNGDVIYLTHYYYPTAVYYSRRKTYAVYSDHPSPSWWILPKSQWREILKQNRVFINASIGDFKELKNQFPDVKFEILFQSGSKLLMEKV